MGAVLGPTGPDARPKPLTAEDLCALCVLCISNAQ